MRSPSLVITCALVAASSSIAAAQPFPIALPADLGGRIADTRQVLPGDLSAFFTVHLDALTPRSTIAHLAGVLVGKGANATVAAVSELAPLGWFAIGNEQRYDLRLARSTFADGVWTVRLVTAQPIQVGDAMALPYRTHPYGVLELRLDGDAEGDGDLYLAADVAFRPDGDIAVDPYPLPPLRLLSLHPTRARDR